MKTFINIIGIVLVLTLTACSNHFFKEPIFPASQYDAGKIHHGLVLTSVGPTRWLPGKAQSWLETCDYAIDRKPDAAYVVFPDYVYTNCVQHGPVHHH